jgi:hypothetical protein
LRSSFREGDKIQHTNHGRITGLTLDQLKLIQAAFRGDVIPKDSPQAFQTINSREYGASYALLQLARELGLDKALYSRNEPMDRLLERQKAIQRTLARKHLQNAHLVLYDITSTYFEGAYAESQIVLFGYNRDGKQGHEQVVIGLLCNAEKLKEVTGLHTISVLTHRQILDRVKRKLVQAELFDEKRIAEVLDPDKPGQRYCLCPNPQSGARETATRQRLLDRTREALNKVVGRKTKGWTENLSAQVGKILARYKMGKFVDWKIQEGHLEWHFNEAHIEQAFRNLKTVLLEIRPVYHKKDDRIRSHVFFDS